MIFISPTSCREQLPDPEFFAQCIRDSFQELLALTTPAEKRQKKKAIAKKAQRCGSRTPRSAAR
jgi:hypothetical protein